MRINALVILHKSNEQTLAKIVCKSMDLSNIGFFQRSTVKEFIVFFSKTIADRISPGQRISVKEQDNLIHASYRRDGLIGLVICDDEYPSRAAFGIIDEILNKITTDVGLEKITQSDEIEYEELNKLIISYQNPINADKILLVQKELDETKAILNKTIEQVLKRGEKLDDLVAKSDDLEKNSKIFFGKSQKLNSCCVLL